MRCLAASYFASCRPNTHAATAPPSSGPTRYGQRNAQPPSPIVAWITVGPSPTAGFECTATDRPTGECGHYDGESDRESVEHGERGGRARIRGRRRGECLPRDTPDRQGRHDRAHDLGHPVPNQLGTRGHLAAEEDRERHRRVVVSSGDVSPHVHHDHQGAADRERGERGSAEDGETDREYQEEGPDELRQVIAHRAFL
jgi:hypothetical protein